MKKSRYTEEQIIGILKQHEAGVKTADLCREHGINASTFYGWKSKFGGMDVSEAERRHEFSCSTSSSFPDWPQPDPLPGPSSARLCLCLRS
jgi:transposase InsO family protein